MLTTGAADAQQAALKWRSASLAPGSGVARVYVTPIEDNGSVGTGLSSQNFEATLDNKHVPIRRVTTGYAADEGIGVVLLLDTSGSMHGAGIHAARQAAVQFVSRLGKNDQVAVINFDDTVHVRQNFTTDKRAATAAIQSVDAVGQHTVLFDAIHKAASLPANLPPGRRAIVLLTDGHDEGSSLKADDIAHLALDNKLLPVYAIGLGQGVDHNVLHRMSTVSGGADLYAPTPGALGGLYANVGRRLADVYNIQVDNPPADGRAHVLEVTWIRPGGIRLSATGSLATNIATADNKPPVTSTAPVVSPAPAATPAPAAGTAPAIAAAPRAGNAGAAIRPTNDKRNDRTRNTLVGAAAVFALALGAGLWMRAASRRKAGAVEANANARAGNTQNTNPGQIAPLPVVSLSPDDTRNGSSLADAERRFSYDSSDESAQETMYGRNAQRASDSPPVSKETMVMRPAKPAARAWLVVVGGPMEGRNFTLSGKEAIVGRADDAQVSLSDDGQISRRHAKIVSNDDGSCTIVDMASTNGIRVNSERVYQHTLRDGDKIELGDSALVFKTLHSPPPATAADSSAGSQPTGGMTQRS